MHKTPSTPDSPEEGVFTALALAAEEKGVAMRSLLEETRVFVHGTTLVTNAVISGNMAKTALLTNEGYEDMLFFGLGSRGKPPSEMFKTHQDYPDPIIPRHLIAGIRGRINAEGGIETELDEAGIRAAVAEFKRRNVESLAVSFLWSITNPEHEERARAIIAEEYPEAQVSIGHQITSVVREYERTSTCALDASIKPLFGRYVKNLIRWLKENGYERDLLMVNSHGGVVKGEELTEFPVYALKSGPSLGPVAGMTVSEAEGAEQDLIVCDMGGTSFDASMVVKGEVVTTLIGSVGPYHYSFPTLDVHSIGAGGGSIAWVDTGGPRARRPAKRGKLAGARLLRPGGRQAHGDRRQRGAGLHLARLLHGRQDADRRGKGTCRHPRARGRAAGPECRGGRQPHLQHRQPQHGLGAVRSQHPEGHRPEGLSAGGRGRLLGGPTSSPSPPNWG